MCDDHSRKPIKVTLTYEGSPSQVTEALHGPLKDAHREAALEGARADRLSNDSWNANEAARKSERLFQDERRQREDANTRTRIAEGDLHAERMRSRDLEDRLARVARSLDAAIKGEPITTGSNPFDVNKDNSAFGEYPANQISMSPSFRLFIAALAADPNMPAASNPIGVYHGAAIGKINTIKKMREVFGLGLKEAKDLVEWCNSSGNYDPRLRASRL